MRRNLDFHLQPIRFGFIRFGLVRIPKLRYSVFRYFTRFGRSLNRTSLFIDLKRFIFSSGEINSPGTFQMIPSCRNYWILPLNKLDNWNPTDVPPYATTGLMTVPLENFLASSLIWMANSRVGATTIASGFCGSSPVCGSAPSSKILWIILWTNKNILRENLWKMYGNY